MFSSLPGQPFSKKCFIMVLTSRPGHFPVLLEEFFHPFECIIPLRLSRTSACGHNPALPLPSYTDKPEK
jgi:hypothetical protein